MDVLVPIVLPELVSGLNGNTEGSAFVTLIIRGSRGDENPFTVVFRGPWNPWSEGII